MDQPAHTTSATPPERERADAGETSDPATLQRENARLRAEVEQLARYIDELADERTVRGDSPATARPRDDQADETPSESTARHDSRTERIRRIQDRKLTIFGPYRIERQVGRGGMGVVYEAVDTRDQRRVAIKLIHAGANASELEQRRFAIEAKAISRLHHPNIVPVHEVGRYGDLDYLAMEYIAGRTLDTWRHETQPGWTELAGIMAKVASAVHYAHQVGVIHRDLKPSNVVVDGSGEPVVMDFGLARDVAAGPGPTISNSAIGSPPYLSPEQAQGQGEQVGPAADVWALGAVLYELLTGQPPFVRDTVYQTLEAIVVDEPVPPRVRDPRVPAPLQAIVLHCLEKVPQARYPSAHALAEDLHRFQQGERVLARVKSPWDAAVRRLRQIPLLGLAVVVVALAVAVLAAGLVLERRQQGGDWQAVYERDFTRPGSGLDGLHILDHRLRAAGDTPLVAADGLGWPHRSYHGSWMWLADVGNGDIRVEAEVVLDRDGDAIELALNARREPCEAWRLPAGYGAKLVARPNATCAVMRAEHSQLMDMSYAALADIRSGQPFTVVFMRVGEHIILELDGRRLLDLVDLLPVSGADHRDVGVRFFQAGTRLRSLRVWRLGLPRQASPLIAGEALQREGQYAAALATFETIARDHAGDPIAEAALARAYLVARKLPGLESGRLEGIRRELLTRHPDSPYREQIFESDAIAAWAAGRTAEAVALLPAVAAINPRSRLALRLHATRRQPLPAPVARDLLRAIAALGDVTSLDLSGLDLDDLGPLARLPLRQLTVARNRISDLAPLVGMPLAQLDISANRVSDLRPLAGLPLHRLNCSANPLSDLTPLSGLPLQNLGCADTAVASLAPLAALPLTALVVSRTRVRELAPVLRPGLRSLECNGVAVSDWEAFRQCRDLEVLHCTSTGLSTLAPFAHLRLARLHCADNALTSLDALAGMRLSELDCAGNRIASLEPLAGSALWRLVADDNRIASLAPIAGQPLAHLSVARNRLTDLHGVEALRLRLLICAGNQIRDLAALATAKVEHLDCSANPFDSLIPLAGCGLTSLDCSASGITTLAPFEHAPPGRLLFESASLPDLELARLRLAWQQSAPALADQVGVLLALRRNDRLALRAAAQPAHGRRWLVLPLPLGHGDALARARALGARLAEPDSAESSRQLATLIGRTWSDAWIGLGIAQGMLRRADGEPAPWRNHDWVETQGADGPLVASAEVRAWRPRAPSSTLPWVVTWDE